MWICNKCETYNEDDEQFCCICNAKKSDLAAMQQGQQGQNKRSPEIKPSERLTSTVVKPPTPKVAPTPLVRGGRDDLMESFGMGSVRKKITTGLVALNVALLLVNILGRIFLA